MNCTYKKIFVITMLLLIFQINVFAASGINITSEFDWVYGNVPSVQTEETPFLYGIEAGRFGKNETDESYFFNTEYNGSSVPAIYDVSSVNIVNPYAELNLNVKSDDRIHLSFEIARTGMELGGYVQVFPYVDGNVRSSFADGGYLMNNNTSNGVQIFGVTDVLGDRKQLPLDSWNKFDYMFYCNYNGTSAVDVYFNGNLIMEKHILDADGSMNQNQLMTGLDKIRFGFNMKKYNGTYPATTTCIDNLICNKNFMVGKYNLECTNKSITADNFYNTIRIEDAVSVKEFISCVPEGYLYTFSGETGVLDEDDYISGAYLRIENSHTGEEFYYYVLPSSDTRLKSDIYYIDKNIINGFAGMSVAELIAGAKTTGAVAVYYADGTPAADSAEAEKGMILKVTSADGSNTGDYVLKYDVYKPYFGFDDISENIPEYYNVFTKYYIPDDAQNSPYAFNLTGGLDGKSAGDKALVFTSEYNGTSVPAMNGISAENIVKPQLRFASDAKELTGEDILHISFEILRTGTGSGFQLQLVPVSGKVNTSNGYPVRYRGGKYGLDIHGQTNSFNQSEALPDSGKWHKYDLVYYTNYDNEGYTAADVYINGEKVLDKKILDFDSALDGNQMLSGLSQIRIWYGMTRDGNSFPKTVTAIDNFSVKVLKEEPDIGNDNGTCEIDAFEYRYISDNKIKADIQLTNRTDMKNVYIIFAQYNSGRLVKAEISKENISGEKNTLSAEFDVSKDASGAKLMCFADNMLTPLGECININQGE